MDGARFGKAENYRAQVGCLQPLWHVATQDAPFRKRINRAALAGNDQHDAGAIGLRLAQKTVKREMCFALPHSVQVDRSLHVDLAALQALPQPPL
jgi:hypothetical protein